jgi:hypothetical protein
MLESKGEVNISFFVSTGGELGHHTSEADIGPLELLCQPMNKQCTAKDMETFALLFGSHF